MATINGGKHVAQALEEFSRNIGKDVSLRVGFLSQARYPDGTSVAMVASILEFGAPRANIPPRPFFRNMISAKQAEWPIAIADLLRDNRYDVELTLKQAGAAIAGQLRQSIKDTNSPPLAPSTIAKKGFDKPLISTSHLWNSVDYEVVYGDRVSTSAKSAS